MSRLTRRVDMLPRSGGGVIVPPDPPAAVQWSTTEKSPSVLVSTDGLTATGTGASGFGGWSVARGTVARSDWRTFELVYAANPGAVLSGLGGPVTNYETLVGFFPDSVGVWASAGAAVTFNSGFNGNVPGGDIPAGGVLRVSHNPAAASLRLAVNDNGWLTLDTSGFLTSGGPWVPLAGLNGGGVVVIDGDCSHYGPDDGSQTWNAV